MSFHVYLEPDLQAKVEAYCKKTGRKRNAVVREALRQYVENHLAVEWPKEVFQFKPDRNMTRFESLRDDLLPVRDEIFSNDNP